MDTLDAALLDAWSRLAPALRADRAQALRRAARLSLPTYSRPIRPWCCCLRASDTRLDPFIPADCAASPQARARRTKRTTGRPASTNRTPPCEHALTIPARECAALCAPVSMSWPGLDWTALAARLGRHEETLRSWMQRGVFELSTRHPQFFAKRGKPVPFLFSPTPLDPSAELGRAPQQVWGTIWQSLHTRIPHTATLNARRIPIFLDYTRRDGSRDQRFRGYQFICPGLGASPCARHTDRLYLPIPLRSIHHMFSKELADLARDTAPTRWACRHCHDIRFCSFTSRNDWNRFITHITSGLLFGHEVKRPPDLRPERRRRKKSARRPSPRRDLAVALRAKGLACKYIASHMGLKTETIYKMLKTARRRAI